MAAASVEGTVVVWEAAWVASTAGAEVWAVWVACRWEVVVAFMAWVAPADMVVRADSAVVDLVGLVAQADWVPVASAEQEDLVLADSVVPVAVACRVA
jgi:hypothetical protein